MTAGTDRILPHDSRHRQDLTPWQQAQTGSYPMTAGADRILPQDSRHRQDLTPWQQAQIGSYPRTAGTDRILPHDSRRRQDLTPWQQAQTGSYPCPTATWGRYHEGRPSGDHSLFSPTVIPPSALDKLSIMNRYHRQRTTR